MDQAQAFQTGREPGLKQNSRAVSGMSGLLGGPGSESPDRGSANANHENTSIFMTNLPNNS